MRKYWEKYFYTNKTTNSVGLHWMYCISEHSFSATNPNSYCLCLKSYSILISFMNFQSCMHIFEKKFGLRHNVCDILNWRLFYSLVDKLNFFRPKHWTKKWKVQRKNQFIQLVIFISSSFFFFSVFVLRGAPFDIQGGMEVFWKKKKKLHPLLRLKKKEKKPTTTTKNFTNLRRSTRPRNPLAKW